MVFDFTVERRRCRASVRLDVVFDLKFVTHVDVGIDLLACTRKADVGLRLFAFEAFVVIFDDGDGLIDANAFGRFVDFRIVGEFGVDEPFGGLDKSRFDAFFDVVGRQPFFMGDRIDDIENIFHRCPCVCSVSVVL